MWHRLSIFKVQSQKLGGLSGEVLSCGQLSSGLLIVRQPKTQKIQISWRHSISQISSTGYAVDHEHAFTSIFSDYSLYFRERNAFIYTIRITLIRDTLPIVV